MASCKCGCGGITSVATVTNKARGYVKGQDYQYMHGHKPKSFNKTHCINGHEFTSENTWRDKFNKRKCRVCMNASNRRWSKKNPDKAYLSCRRVVVQRTYGLTMKEYNSKLAKQNNVCALCTLPFSESEKKCLDHDHKSNKIREFLHDGCNRALGFFKDDPRLCRKAAEYLERHKENSNVC